MAVRVPCAVSQQQSFPPELVRIIELVTILCAAGERRVIQQVTALLEHHVADLDREAREADKRGA